MESSAQECLRKVDEDRYAFNLILHAFGGCLISLTIENDLGFDS